jgi:TPP-dependent pyruvate/acetoin dehydrogenase alpha subunit
LAAAGVDEAAIAEVDERGERLIEEAVEFASTSASPSVEEFVAEVAS